MSLHSKFYSQRGRSSLDLKKGFSLVEVLVAVTVITVALTAVLSASARGASLARRGLEETQVAFLLEEGAEAVKFARAVSWGGLAALANGPDYHPSWGTNGWSLAAGAEVSGKFTRKIQFAEAYRDSSDDLAESGAPDPDARRVVISINWDTGNAVVTKNLEFYVINLFE